MPGNLDRDARWWDRLLRDDEYMRKGAAPGAYLLHTEPDGEVTGYAAYRVKGDWTEHGEPDGTLTVEEVRAATRRRTRPCGRCCSRSTWSGRSARL